MRIFKPISLPLLRRNDRRAQRRLDGDVILTLEFLIDTAIQSNASKKAAPRVEKRGAAYLRALSLKIAGLMQQQLQQQRGVSAVYIPVSIYIA